MHNLNTTQEVREIALHLGLTDNTTFLLAGYGKTHVTDLLIATGHYPFVDSWDLDCGLLGKHVAVPEHGDGQAATGEVLSTRRVRTPPSRGFQRTGQR